MNEKFVTVGGGSGSFALLRGLKKYKIDLTAIVSMSDDGGSSGVLRSELGALPFGDVRKCLLALADKDIWYEIFTYRFGKDYSDREHSLGNLLLNALSDIKGSPESGIEAAEKLLNTRGGVVPVTLDYVRLIAELENGVLIKGESNIDIPKHDGNIPVKRIFLEPKAFAYYKAIEKIQDADIIVIGPGDLYTSIIPNFLVNGISDAVRECKAKKIYVCNLMTKFGETNDFSVQDFYNKVIDYLGSPCIDYVIYNSNSLSDDVIEKYAEENQFPVRFDTSVKIEGNPVFVKGDFVYFKDVARHDSKKLARKIMELV
jgi:uncharacterized cofD-like protein